MFHRVIKKKVARFLLKHGVVPAWVTNHPAGSTQLFTRYGVIKWASTFGLVWPQS